MAKKKKNSSLVYSPETVKATKKQLKAFNWKRLLIIAGSTLAAFALLEGILAVEAQARLGFSIILPIYYISATLLGAAVVFLNHGLSKGEITPDMIRDDVEPDEKTRICEMIKRHRAIAKKLMLVLIPILMAILLDFMYLFWGDTIAKIFGFIFVAP